MQLIALKIKSIDLWFRNCAREDYYMPLHGMYSCLT